MTSGRTPDEPNATRRIPPTPADESFSSAAHPSPPWHYEAPAARPQQATAPQRRSSGCLGVVLTLCLAVWASIGTVLLLYAWAQTSAGTPWTSSVQQTISGAISDSAGFGETLVAAPMLLVAGALCVVAALLMPSAVGLVRGSGVFLLLGAAATYAAAVVLDLEALTGDTLTRWQAAAELWPSVEIADLVLVPLFVLAALVCVITTSPRKR
ncbi:hypothetical protein [Nesterenkonia natronophila]|uniref:Uncharacterized protein n=1 Tax=Nesterenkonia natronophila TaxID=2174932 RepID=A0A3A4F1V0_9MICC|nr:hypothetical protein [Nesterenkonia natronophila]RJN31806.1 hypothetical protein D3250_06700 [Nesterenkonia natronophila]